MFGVGLLGLGGRWLGLPGSYRPGSYQAWGASLALPGLDCQLRFRVGLQVLTVADWAVQAVLCYHWAVFCGLLVALCGSSGFFCLDS